ncbi:MAG TPA: SRPBCC family protein [Gemmatimonadaceae bacterium]|nr:SRPBCC family protein [Gemmatimonadaceae bacterium]
MAATTAPGATVVVRRTFRAPVARVFRAWSDPSMAQRWSWGPEYDTVSIDLSCQPGGSWRQHIRDRTTGENWYFDGVFEEVVPNRKLVHTFHFTSDRGHDEPPSLVTIEFLDRGESTDVVLTHTRLAETKVRETNDGWEAIFGVMEGLIE